jgi:hypothetical protein
MVLLNLIFSHFVILSSQLWTLPTLIHSMSQDPHCLVLTTFHHHHIPISRLLHHIQWPYNSIYVPVSWTPLFHAHVASKTIISLGADSVARHLRTPIIFLSTVLASRRYELFALLNYTLMWKGSSNHHPFLLPTGLSS